MTADLTARIAEILMQHRGWLASDSPGAYCLCNKDFGSLRRHAAHVAALIAAAAQDHYRPVIEAVEQLDALPVGAVLADIDCDLTPPPVYVRFIDGWSLDGLKVKPSRQNLTVLWTPGAGE